MNCFNREIISDLGGKVSNERYVRVSSLPALADIADNREDAATTQ